MSKHPAVYIVTNRPRGTLYVGMTSNLAQRVWQHRTHALPGFTDRYNLERLVWYEMHDSLQTAIRREKAIKHWVRDWKIALIEQENPNWRDLGAEAMQG